MSEIGKPSFAVNDDETACGWQWVDDGGDIYWLDIEIEDGSIRTWSQRDGTREWDSPINACAHMQSMLEAAARGA